MIIFISTNILYRKINAFKLTQKSEAIQSKIIKNKRLYILLLIQYIPGSIPWGALTVYIFPFIQSKILFNKLDSVNMLTLLGIGMIIGTYLAALLGDWLKKKDKEQTIYLLLLLSFVLSEVFVYFFLTYLSSINKYLSYIIIFLAGIVLAFPGTYIKGILFTGLNEIQIRRIFSIENFLESIGKGLGPFVVSLLIIITGDLLSSMLYSLMFWNISIIILLFAFYWKKEIYEI